MQKQCFEQEIVLQQIHQTRQLQKRLGGRKLLIKLQPFMKAHGIEMGRDSFFNLLAANRLLVRKRKRGKPVTTHSFHRYKKYKNLIRDYVPTAANRLWVSDITYITLRDGFAYLSLITDAYSRKIVGFHLSKTLEAAGSLQALDMALKTCTDTSSLIHHSDRGVQYCCNDYVKLLEKNKLKISMTENGDPLENAIAERVNGILKDELLDMCYTGFEDAQLAIATAVSIYNYHRPHSSVSYLTPAVAHQTTDKLERKWKNYYSPKTTPIMQTP